jgi:predicted nucleic acid-binding protein
MVMVDSSVWIDYFRDRSTQQTDFLDANWSNQFFAVGDLVLAEVLQGCDTDQEFEETRSILLRLEQIEIAGTALAQQAAQNYRFLRARGITVRKTIDTLIATRCMIDGHHLLYSDRDFDPFVAHLGLISAIGPAH